MEGAGLLATRCGVACTFAQERGAEGEAEARTQADSQLFLGSEGESAPLPGAVGAVSATVVRAEGRSPSFLNADNFL